MMREALAHFPLAMLPLLTLGIFVGVFVGVLFWVYRRGTQELYSEMSALPLREQDDRHDEKVTERKVS